MKNWIDDINYFKEWRFNENIQELAAINREVFVGWFADKGADISATNPIEKFEKRWKSAGITYDPNMDFVTGLFDYLDQRGLVKGKAIDDFVQIDLLNQALAEMGRPTLKR